MTEERRVIDLAGVVPDDGKWRYIRATGGGETYVDGVRVTPDAVRADAVEALATAQHLSCIERWEQRAAGDPDWQGTQHGVDAHRAEAEDDVAALASAGWSLRRADPPLGVRCASCNHRHDEAAWSSQDPDDGTCWATAGPLVCGCPKFITQAVAAYRRARRAP